MNAFMNMNYNVAMKKNIKRILSVLLVAPILIGCSNNVGRYGKKATDIDLSMFFKYKIFSSHVLLDGWYEYDCTFKNKEYVVTTKMYFEFDHNIRGNFIYTCFISKTGTRLEAKASDKAWTLKTTYKDGTTVKQHGEKLDSWRPDGKFFNFTSSYRYIPDAYIDGNPIYFIDDSNNYVCTIKYDDTFINVISGTESYEVTTYAQKLSVKRKIKSCEPKDIEIVIDEDSEYISKYLDLDYT